MFLSIHCCALAQHEYIKSFDVHISVHEDGVVDINERITVYAHHEKIKHGIVREIPTQYFYYGFVYSPKFTLQLITLDNKPAPYFTQNVSNGIKVYIGDAQTTLSPGFYTYEIAYQVRRVLGFFKDFDELYWNITGNGWRLPIKSVKATIELPAAAANQSIEVWGYTGYIDQKRKDYIATRQDNTIIVESTRAITPGQGLTVALAIPKGIFREPTQFQQWIDFLIDNWIHGLLLLGLLAILLTYLIAWLRRIIDRRKHLVIPLFYPPEDCSAGAARYVTQQQYDLVGLSADLVQLAVAGCITIDAEKKTGIFNSSSVYTLKKATAQPKTHEHRIAMDILFRFRDAIVINETNQSIFDQLYRALESHYALSYQALFQRPVRVFTITIGITLVMAILIILQLYRQPTALTLIIIFVLLLVHVFWYGVLKGYTDRGQQYRNEIDGFSLYLKTAELDRMKLIGTPPIKTPELFETYLPYAIALGLEKEWRAQFTALFERLKSQQHPYASPWLTSPSGLLFNASAFTQQLQSSTTISSSGVPPGFSSGSGGRGSSGGGAGGGGGGGW